MSELDLSGLDRILDDPDPIVPFVVEGDLHRWSLSGSRIQLEMHSAAVFRISQDLAPETAAHDRPAGLLLGRLERLDSGTTRLEVICVAPCDSRDLGSALLNSDAVLGFYRITGRRGLAFTDRDMNLVRKRFPDRDKVFLLVRSPGADHADVRFFYWNEDEKGIGSEPSEFPAEIRWGAPKTDVAVKPAAVVAPLPSLGPSEEGMGWIQPAKARMLGLIQSITAVAPKYGEPSAAASGWGRLKEPAVLLWIAGIAAALIVTSVMWRGDVTPKSLDLTTTVAGGGFRLNWTRGDPVASATEGFLTILDGDRQQEISLDPKQLLEESIVYVPTSDKVSFTLQILEDEVVHRASLTVLAPRPPGTVSSASPPASIPAQPQPQPPVPSPAAQQPARPERVVRALRRPPIVSPPSRKQAASNPPEPPPPAAATISPQPPAVAPPPVQVQASTPTQSTPATPRVKEQAAPERQIVVPKPEVAQESQVAQRQSRPEAIHEPAPQPVAPAVIQPAPPTSPVASAAPPAARHVPPVAIKQVKPIVPRTLKALISQEILMDVNLSIDETGRVIKAEPSTGSGVLQTSLGKLAAAAARHWKFQPARQGNRNVPGEARIQFQFIPGN